MSYLLILLVALTALPALAAPITTIFTGSGSGTLGGDAFTDAAFTVTLIGDTDTQTSFGNGFFVENSSTVIDIAGLGSLVFTEPTTSFVNNDLQLAGFSQLGSDLYFGNGGAALGTYDLLSSIGPLSISAELLLWGTGVPTSGGILDFNDASDIEGTFQAIVDSSTVPEPGSTVLIVLGTFAILLASRRRVIS